MLSTSHYRKVVCVKIRAVFLFLIIIAFSAISYSSPQWLRYCAQENATSILGGSSRNVNISKDKPDGLVLPELNSFDVRYAKWGHQMGAKKDRQIILDRQKKYGKYDIMYFDSNADGKLSESEKYLGKRSDQYRVTFSGIPVYFETEEGTITYHLNFYYYSYSDSTERLYSQNGCWYEGIVDFSGEKVKCILMDYNLNGSFNDTSDSFDCDRIFIGEDSDKYETYAGKFLEYKGILYYLDIARDGAYINIEPANDIAYSDLEIPDSVTTFVCGGSNGLFRRDNISDGKVSLPVGHYKVRSWQTKAKDAIGRQWEMGASWLNSSSFDIAEGNVVKLDVGREVYSSLSVSHNNGTYNFNHRLTGTNGETVNLTRGGSRPEAPKVRIYNRDRTYDQTFSLEYG